MRHPSRFLIDYVAGELSPARRCAVEKHILRCARCHRVVEQEQAIRRRLLSASTPDPSTDLCERILRRSSSTGPLGADDMPTTEIHPLGGDQRLSGSHAHRNRTVLAVGGGLAVATIATLTAAYALGSEIHPGDVAAAGGSASVAESFHTVSTGASTVLSSNQVQQLRDDGWFCPELQALGFELVRAEALEINDRPTLQLDLTDGSHSLTIYEQRGHVPGAAQSPPVNAASGNTVHEDGFEEIGGAGQTVWLHPGRAWQLVIDSDSATYTVVSTLPVADMPSAVSQLMVNEHSRLAHAGPDAPDDPLSRIMRGLGKLAQPGP